MAKSGSKLKAPKKSESAFRFEAVKVEPLFEVLDAIAWLDSPTIKEISQFANLDPRTAGKLLKNARAIVLVDTPDDESYVLCHPYPYKGSLEQKRAVVKEALLRMPLIAGVRQFISMGNDLSNAMRKAATIAGEQSYDAANITPLIKWAETFKVLDPDVRVDVLVNDAVAAKQVRHVKAAEQRVAFISHSSKDKKFVRQLASDLISNGVQVWVDEQRIRVGDSIPEKIAQGLAESDYFLLIVSENSVESAWVQKELNGALIREIERRQVTVLPIKIDEAKVPDSIVEKKYADFSGSYETGLNELLLAVKS